MLELKETVLNFYENNPHYGYLFASTILFIVALGNFLDWRWAVNPGGYRQVYWYKRLGHDRFRKIMGIIFLIGGLCSLVCFFLSNK